MILLSSNDASTTLGAGISSSTTTIVLAPGGGGLFPSPAANEYFTLTLNDAATRANYEICNCTARTGDSLTVTRGAEGTTARSWLLGDFAYNTNTANSIGTARAYAAGNTPTLPFTIPAAHQGVVQYCGTAGTITLPAVAGIQDGFLCAICCTSNAATITVNTNSATVVLPSGNVTSTFTLTALQQTVTLQWNAGASLWYGLNSSAAPPPPPVPGSWVITASTTFTVPTGVGTLEIELWGGGSGGVGGTGAAGSAGGYAWGVYSVTPGTEYTVLIGAGGAGVTGASGSSSGAGGETSFGGTLIYATGGLSVGPSSLGIPSEGGMGFGGDLNLPGGSGGDLCSTFFVAIGGAAPRGAAGGFGQPGQTAGYGAGGGAAANQTLLIDYGGNGGGGLVIVRW
jgi:hypothetical protein